MFVRSGRVENTLSTFFPASDGKHGFAGDNVNNISRSGRGFVLGGSREPWRGQRRIHGHFQTICAVDNGSGETFPYYRREMCSRVISVSLERVVITLLGVVFDVVVEVEFILTYTENKHAVEHKIDCRFFCAIKTFEKKK